MKFLITSDCQRKGGDPVSAGDVIECDQQESAELKLAGRGYAVTDDFKAPSESESPDTEAAEAAEATEATEAAEAATGDGTGEVLPPVDDTPKTGKGKK